jgi:hypothetical protein
MADGPTAAEAAEEATDPLRERQAVLMSKLSKNPRFKLAPAASGKGFVIGGAKR